MYVELLLLFPYDPFHLWRVCSDGHSFVPDIDNILYPLNPPWYQVQAHIQPPTFFFFFYNLLLFISQILRLIFLQDYPAIWAVGESKYLFFQGSVKLKDVLVDFSWEQWECLNADQKNLYKMVMLDSYEHMMSLGKNKFSQLISCLF